MKPVEKTAWQRVEAVIKWANMSTNHFARHIGLARGENLYQIKRGNNGVSLDVAGRIVNKFPQIDKLWLLTGEGQMFKAEAVSDDRFFEEPTLEKMFEASQKMTTEQEIYNITPRQIVERYLPNYKERLAAYKMEHRTTVAILFSEELDAEFCFEHFAEAIAERDRQMCERQRNMCGNRYVANLISPIKGDIEEYIRNAPMPKMEE